jgi:hypothetical protein
MKSAVLRAGEGVFLSRTWSSRGMLDAWNRRDVESLRALSAPEAEFVNSPTAVEPGTRHGADAVAADAPENRAYF